MQFSSFLNSIGFAGRESLLESLTTCLPPHRLAAANDIASRTDAPTWPVFTEREYTRFYYQSFLDDYVQALGSQVDPTAFARACLLHYTVRLTLPGEALLDAATLRHVAADVFALTHGDPAYSSVVYVPASLDPQDPGARYRSRHTASGVTGTCAPLQPGDCRYIGGSATNLKSRLGGQGVSTVVVAADLPLQVVEATLDAVARNLSPDLFVLVTGDDTAVRSIIAGFGTWFGRANVWAEVVVPDPRGTIRFSHLAVSPSSRLGRRPTRGHEGVHALATRPLRLEDRHQVDGGYRYLAGRQEIADRADRAEVVGPARRMSLTPPKTLLAPAKFAEQMRGNFAADIDTWWRSDFVDLPAGLNVMFRDVRLVGCGHCFTQDGFAFDAQLSEVTLPDFLRTAGVNRSDVRADESGSLTSARAAAAAHVVEQPAIYIGNGGLPMHAHFLMDVVGKLGLLGSVQLHDKLIVLPSMVTPDQLDDIARVYDIPHEHLRIYDEHRALHFKELHLLPICKMPPWLAPEMVFFLRRGLARARFPDRLDPAACKRLFVGRGRVEGGPRRLLNEEELRETVLRDGYVDIEPSDFPLEEEMALFANADEVIFIYGSACGNVVYCRPEARILILQSDAMTEKTFGMASGLLGMQYGYVFGSSYHRWVRGHNSDWVIDPALVTKALAQLRA